MPDNDYIKQLETALDTYQHLLDESHRNNDMYSEVLGMVIRNLKYSIVRFNTCLKMIEDPDERSDRYLAFIQDMRYSIERLYEELADLESLIGDKDV